MKRILVILMLALSVSGFVSAEPYQEYSQERLQALFGLENEQGEYVVELDVPGLVEIIQSLEKHAVSYPVKFDSESDRKLAQRDIVYLTNVMDIIFPNVENDVVLLNLVIRLNNISYNMDVQSEKANERLLKAAEAVFKAEPDNIETHYRLGYFLAASNRVDEALPHLEKAAQNGVVNANYTLAMVYLSRENLDKALEYLTVYQTHSPENSEVNGLIEAIKNGELKIEKKQE